tara:strand:- start:227 stop:793 length:567 start_codon:yes stop_codon:yes gene_type:complete
VTRTVISTILSKFDDAEVSPFYAIELLFDVNPVFAWTGYGDITLDGTQTYTGVGELLQISEVQETQDIAAKGLTLKLSGIPSDLLSLALSTPYQGRLCNVKLGFLDWSNVTNQNTMLIFTGYMDQMTIDEGPETSTITTSVESRLIDLERPRTRRYTAENQKQRNSGDLAFDFVESLQNLRLQWGGSG